MAFLRTTIEDVVIAPRSPWQNPFVERAVDSIRRDCLGHVIVLNERHLRRILRAYVHYYHRSRTHLSHPRWGTLSPSHKSAVFITNTCG
ncbi:MAG: transposase [Gammaproteobacteria bacterium]|nr:transposase [Gammaproteobacteria bacterium]